MDYIEYHCARGKPARHPSACNDTDAYGEARPIPGLPERFLATACGRILKNGKPLGGDLHYKGYRRVCLVVDGKSKHFPIHTLVAMAFIGPRPEGHHVDHVDFDKENNSPENLRYLPAMENTLRRRPKGSGGAVMKPAQSTPREGADL